jgi:predicted RNA binding protein YcfA (HicA-like mRNA interferase family)
LDDKKMSAKLPRDLGGRDLAVLLNRHFGYAIGRQSGSHMRMTTSRGGEHHLTIPDAKPLRVGTLAGILGDVAAHFDISRSEVERQLFET